MMYLYGMPCILPCWLTYLGVRPPVLETTRVSELPDERERERHHRRPDLLGVFSASPPTCTKGFHAMERVPRYCPDWMEA